MTKWIVGLMICAVCAGPIHSVQADTVVVFNEIMYNPAEQEPQVEIVDSSLDQVPKLLEVAPLSVSLYKFEI